MKIREIFKSVFRASLVVLRDTVFLRESPMKLHPRVMLPLLLMLCLPWAGGGERARKVFRTVNSTPHPGDATKAGEPVAFDFTVLYTADRTDYVVLAEDNVEEPDYKGRTIIVAKDKVAGF